MSETVPFALPELGPEEAQAAGDAILSGWVTQGPRVKAFEESFAARVGAKYAVAVSNCTTALHLALRGVGVKQGDEVLLPSHSFVASANSVTYLGAKPVFVDIDPDTYNLAPGLLRGAITEKTTAIMAVHQVGQPADMEAILSFAGEHDIPVVEDAACAIGSRLRYQGSWEEIGKPHGEVACFSFHPRKLLTTGDGGMLTTSSAELANKFRLWRHHGMSVPDSVRHGSSQVVFEEYVDVAYNYRLTDIQAAVGLEQLKRLNGIVSARRRLAQRYVEKLSSIPGLGLPVEPDYVETNWQTFLVRLPEGCSQYEVMQELRDRGISTRRGTMCAHREPGYLSVDWLCTSRRECNCSARTCRELAISEKAQDQSVALPLFSTMTKNQQDRVVSCLEEVLRAWNNKDQNANTVGRPEKPVQGPQV